MKAIHARVSGLRSRSDSDLASWAIEQQLSRIELAHRFTRDVAVGNPREFDHSEMKTQEAPETCRMIFVYVALFVSMQKYPWYD